MKQHCPCGLKNTYEACCKLIHEDFKRADSAEKVMRARYTAFVVQDIDFLIQTYHPSTRGFQDRASIAQWARENKWLGLEVIAATKDTVEFKASYLDPHLKLEIHHEKSDFKEFEGSWFFVEGYLVD